ncbi:flagellar hook-length control protein FliK [Terrabacter aerolatus]|uniref:flagellar hook-length control protein FliK n=1 Tax=Terrabacter aerolatus TaxID=422442 RepID=UPI0016499597|nr:flagellar hook-length control protein FliK [Terrabacter aerolatus]
MAPQPAHAPAAPFAAQLSRPLVELTTGAPGEHVLTIRVSPEHLGPVTVRAHLGADGIRIQLFSPDEVSRAAVHAVLPDLRRDLAGTGLGASLDLSDRPAPQANPSAQHGSSHQAGQSGHPGDGGPGTRRDVPQPAGRHPSGSTSPDPSPGANGSGARPDPVDAPRLPSSVRLDVIA